MLRIANERCLFVKLEFLKHLAEDVIKSHSELPNFVMEDSSAMTAENMQPVSRIPLMAIVNLSP